jgi:uncharacterized protein YdhG (YjbR/CyaY superfamily)
MRGAPVAVDIDAYIAAAPATVRARLTKIRTIIAKAAQGATEAIVYGMPTFRLHGNLLHFAVFTHHIGLYPGPDAIAAHAADLVGYATSKGTIQFPLDRPLPVTLIAAIARHCVEARVAHAALKAAIRKASTKMASKKKASPGTTSARTASAGKTSSTKRSAGPAAAKPVVQATR